MQYRFYVHRARDGIHSYLLPLEMQKQLSAGQIYEQELIDWALQFVHADKLVIDIGAHTGTWTAQMAPRAKLVMSFEPQKSIWFALCGTIALHALANVNCINASLGSLEQEGISLLYTFPSDKTGSNASLFRDSHNSETARTEPTYVHILDNFSFPHPISFIRIDTGGNEEHIIRGALTTIARFRPHILFRGNGLDGSIGDLLKSIQYDTFPIANSRDIFLSAPL